MCVFIGWSVKNIDRGDIILDATLCVIPNMDLRVIHTAMCPTVIHSHDTHDGARHMPTMRCSPRCAHQDVPTKMCPR